MPGWLAISASASLRVFKRRFDVPSSIPIDCRMLNWSARLPVLFFTPSPMSSIRSSTFLAFPSASTRLTPSTESHPAMLLVPVVCCSVIAALRLRMVDSRPAAVPPDCLTAWPHLCKLFALVPRLVANRDRCAPLEIRLENARNPAAPTAITLKNLRADFCSSVKKTAPFLPCCCRFLDAVAAVSLTLFSWPSASFAPF